jgi:hypothetical protein
MKLAYLRRRGYGWASSAAAWSKRLGARRRAQSLPASQLISPSGCQYQAVDSPECEVCASDS